MDKSHKKLLGDFIYDALEGNISPQFGSLSHQDVITRIEQTGVITKRTIIHAGRVRDWKRGQGRFSDELLLGLRRAFCADSRVITDDPLFQPNELMCSRWDEIFEGDYAKKVKREQKGIKRATPTDFDDIYNPDCFIGTFEFLAEKIRFMRRTENHTSLLWALSQFGASREYTQDYIADLLNKYLALYDVSEKEKLLSDIFQFSKYHKVESSIFGLKTIIKMLQETDELVVIQAYFDLIYWLPSFLLDWVDLADEINTRLIPVLIQNLQGKQITSEISSYCLAYLVQTEGLFLQGIIITPANLDRMVTILKDEDLDLPPFTIKWLAIILGDIFCQFSPKTDYIFEWAEVADGAKSRSDLHHPTNNLSEEDKEWVKPFVKRFETSKNKDKKLGLAILLRRIGVIKPSFYTIFKDSLEKHNSNNSLNGELIVYIAHDFPILATDYFLELHNSSPKELPAIVKDWAFLAIIGTADLRTLTHLYKKSFNDPNLDSVAIFNAATTGFIFGQGTILLKSSWWRSLPGRQTLYQCLKGNLINLFRF